MTPLSLELTVLDVMFSTQLYPIAENLYHHAGYYWLSLVITGYHWLFLVVTGYHWLLLAITGYCWLLLVINWLGLF